MKTLTEQLKERLTSIDDAYNETGRPKVDFSVYPEDMRDNKEAAYHADVIVEAARKIERENGSGEIDWNNSRAKYIPWFLMSPSGFAFFSSCYGYSHAEAGGGSRLRVLNRETSDYLGETFLEVWKAMQLK